MRAYEGSLFSHLWFTIAKDLCYDPDHTVAPRGKVTSEIADAVIRLECREDDDGIVPGRTSPRYLAKEIGWYCSKDERAIAISKEASLWASIQNQDGTVNSNYGSRLWGGTGRDGSYGTEWGWCVGSLLRDEHSRQAVAVIHRPRDHWDGNKDVPCTLNMSWSIRDGRLDMRVHMRSSDVWFGLPYDVPFFLWLQRLMRAQLNREGRHVGLGALTLWLDSLHLYEEKRMACVNMVNQHEWAVPTVLLPSVTGLTLQDALKQAQVFADGFPAKKEVLA